MIIITDALKKVIAGWVVLIIDDEPDSLEVARRVLTFQGATVYTASNGVEGLEIARSVRPSFILSDISMPVMDGWEFMHHLKEDVEMASIPVVALTAHAMPGDKERILKAGFYSYLTKPLSPMSFLQDLLTLFSVTAREAANNTVTLL
jgi:two-component system, cell cycle response regulator DivK